MSSARPLIVTVSGIDGSGKSEFGQRLWRCCTDSGLKTTLLRVDDFRRAVDFQASGRSEMDVYYADYFDLKALDEAVSGWVDASDGTNTRVLIVEGIFARRVPGLVGAYSIWLEVERAQARRRIETRDVAGGRTLDEVRHRIDARYFPAQDRYAREFDPVAAADLIVENTDFTRPRIVRGADASRWPPRLHAALVACFGAF